MSIVTKKNKLLEDLEKIHNKSEYSKTKRRKANEIIRRLCEAEVSIDLDEEEFEIDGGSF